MNVASFQQFAVDRQIREMVMAAWKGGGVLRLSVVTKQVRTRRPGVVVHHSYVLDRLVKTAAKKSVAIEVDIPLG